MTDAARPDPLIGAALDGRYVIERRLARGGMSTVYVARDAKLLRLVAVKVLYPHLAEDPSFVRRFESEAISAAKLSHPHVVSVHDQGVDGDTAYLVLEYVPGATLHDVLRTQGALSPRAAVQVTDAVLSGLAAAHDAGLVHRDVKPQNVLLAPDGRIEVADFGLARAATAHTATAALIGTAAYLSPELVEGKPADARTDLYAVGIMLYEMLTGEQPFTGETTWQIALQHLNSSVPAPSTLVPGLAAEFDELVRWCTEKDPEARPHDAGAMLQELRHIRAGLDDEQLDLGEEPTPLAPLLASTLALMGRSEAAAAATVPDAAGSPRALGERSAGGRGADAVQSPATQDDADDTATTVLGESAAALQDDRDEDSARLDDAGFDTTGQDDTATTVLSPASAEDGDRGPSGEAGHAGDATGPGIAPDTDPDTAATTTIGMGPVGGADPATRVMHRGDDPTEASTRDAHADPTSNPATTPMSDRASAPGTAPMARSAHPGVPRLPADTAPVEPGPHRSKRQARAAEREARKDAQRPTVKLGRRGTARRAWIWSVVVVVLAALLGTGAWFFGAGPGARVLIPDLAGRTEAQATADLSAQGLSVTRTEVFDERVAAGSVVDTDPAAGQKIAKYRSLELHVSKGPHLYDVPNVVGQSKDAATKALTRAHLKVGTVSEDYDESMPAGNVISQGKKVGADLRSGTAVNLVLSKGPAPVAVPDLTHRSPEDATTLLEASGLTGTAGDEVFSDDVEQGSIAGQDTDAGTDVARGTEITFHVSKGPEMVDVPTVVGKSPDDARSVLEDAGFQVEVKEGSFGVVFNRVATQSPAGGTAERGSTVTLGVY